MQITDAQQQVENMKNEIYIKSDNSKVNENLLVENVALKERNQTLENLIIALSAQIKELNEYIKGDIK